MLPNRHLAWIGLSCRAVAAELKRVGIRSINFPSVRKPGAFNAAPQMSVPEDAVYYAVAVESEVPGFDATSEHIELSRVWRQKLALMVSDIEDVLSRKTVDLMVVVQGYEPSNAAARFVAIRQGIPVLAVENTALASRMLWDNVSGITTNKNLAKNYFWKYRGVFSEAEIADFLARLQVGLPQEKSAEHTTPAVELPESHRPTVLFLGQVLTDSSVVFGVGEWESPIRIIESLCVWCNKVNHRLIIKLHPKESMGINTINGALYNKLTYRKIQQSRRLVNLLAENDAIVDFENEFDTYALIRNARFAVTVNSQSGLEAALMGTPVVLAGDAFYGGLGFTVDAADPRSAEDRFEEAMRAHVPDLAGEFAYIFFERYCRPRTVGGLVRLIEEIS